MPAIESLIVFGGDDKPLSCRDSEPDLERFPFCHDYSLPLPDKAILGQLRKPNDVRGRQREAVRSLLDFVFSVPIT